MGLGYLCRLAGTADSTRAALATPTHPQLPSAGCHSFALSTTARLAEFIYLRASSSISSSDIYVQKTAGRSSRVHEFDTRVLRLPDPLDEDTWEHALVPSAATNVSGCSDAGRPELWVDHCSVRSPHLPRSPHALASLCSRAPPPSALSPLPLHRRCTTACCTAAAAPPRCRS